MTSGLVTAGGCPQRRISRWLSRQTALPLSLRSVLRFYARTGELDLTALRIRTWVDETVDGFLDEAFDAIEEEIEAQLGYSSISFEYETKLTMPVELTLAYLYRTAVSECDAGINPVTGKTRTPIAEYARISYDKKQERRRKKRLLEEAREEIEFVEEAERVARLCTEALIDGDMRDAINDQEFGDFQVDIDLAREERARIAEIAQSCLEQRVERQLPEFPDAVADPYRTAKEQSESHQEDDPRFRDLMTAAKAGDEDAVAQIESEYKFAPFENPPEILTDEEQTWPYCKTQYERVGVIYEGMIEMFRAADLPIEEEFKHAVVVSIIGAQIWLDDIDDFDADLRENQLTPVTAEYLINESETAAFQNIVDISEKYLDRAIESAVNSESLLTGIATEYIYLSVEVGTLPGSD